MPSMVQRRLEYPANREMPWQATSNTPAANGWSIDNDHRHWSQSRRIGPRFYKDPRRYFSDEIKQHELTRYGPTPADFYNTNAGHKSYLTRQVQRSPARYSQMRQEAPGRDDVVAENDLMEKEEIGPGTYDPPLPAALVRRDILGASIFGTSPFAAASSGRSATAPEFFSPSLSEGPDFSSLQDDLNRRNLRTTMHRSSRALRVKGAVFSKTQRFPRLPGPGSNLQHTLVPGPGAYGTVHVLPPKGYMGTQRGFNLNH